MLRDLSFIPDYLSTSEHTIAHTDGHILKAYLKSVLVTLEYTFILGQGVIGHKIIMFLFH